MKKILALFLVVAMVFSFAACGDEDRTPDTSSGQSVDANTIEIVNNAFTATQKAVGEAKTLGYEMNFIYSVTVDDAVISARASSKIDYIDTDAGRKFAAKSVTKSGEQSVEALYYDDTENLYVYGAGETYLLVGKDVEEYIAEQFKAIRVIDTSDLKALDTLIVDAANNAHGFVVDYDPNSAGLDITKYMSGLEAVFDAETLKNLNFKVTSVSVSGIVDSTGKLSSESFKIAYEFTQEIEVPKNEVNPETSETTETTEKVIKTVKNELSFDLKFDFDLTEVKAPDEITVIGEETEGDGEGEGEGDKEEPKAPSEISVTDFNKLLMGTPSLEKNK